MHRADVEIRFQTVTASDVRAQMVAHHVAQPYVGDSFMGHRLLTGRAANVIIDDTEAGLAVSHDGHLAHFKLNHEHRRLSRQAVEAYLAVSGISDAYVASWDRHHLDLVGGFASTITPQAYQFALLNESDLRDPVDGMSLRPATHDDLTYLTAQDFLDDYDGPLARDEVRIAEQHGAPVGIGIVAAHALSENVVDIGMYTEPSERRKGVGSAILVVLARAALERGKRVSAGCWWRNWESRPSIESAGLTCVGTIFQIRLDANRFASA